MTMLRVTEVVGGYGAFEDILKGPSIGVAAGEIVTIIGPNGAGKSTPLKAIAGLVSLKAGRIEFADVDVTREDTLGRARAGISFVPQERNVFGALSVAENLSISAFLSPQQETRRRDDIYARYPMLHGKRRALARTLSGGQRKILAMAMGLMSGPQLMLLDHEDRQARTVEQDDGREKLLRRHRREACRSSWSSSMRSRRCRSRTAVTCSLPVASMRKARARNYPAIPVFVGSSWEGRAIEWHPTNQRRTPCSASIP